MDKVSVLLGDIRNETVTNCILLIVKHELYKCKWNRTNITILGLKRIIKGHMDLTATEVQHKVKRTNP